MLSVTRYWHTLRYLRPVQVYGRIWFRLYRPRPDVRPAPAARPVEGAWVAPVARAVSLLGPTTFRLLNATHALAAGPEAWNDPVRDKLWLYNLHYFDDLNAGGALDADPLAPLTVGRAHSSLVRGADRVTRALFLNEDGLAPSALARGADTPRRRCSAHSPHAGEGRGEAERAARDLRPSWHLALLQRWVAENPPGHGNGWEPYPTSLRIVNWIKWALAPSGQGALPPECLHSLAIQARWLRRRLEYHLLGNHLFANAKALVFAGAFFIGSQEAAGAVAREPGQWLVLGQRLLRRELAEQILPDGGHFERSPMYHAILLEDVLDVINLAGAYPGTLDPGLVSLCRERATAMLGWLAVMCHPDGEIGFFNDAAMGIAPCLAELVAYGRRLGVEYAGEGHFETRPGRVPASVWLRDSGYVRLESGPAVALLDVAPIGPDYLPGHAHADTLSCELSLFGQRVIVNGGTSRYGTGPERLAQRGTAAHSTVQIDGADSSEVWGGFRVARRARAFGVQVRGGGVAHGRVAHSAVELDGDDSSAVWGGFRVARRAWAFAVRVLRGRVAIRPSAGAEIPRLDDAGEVGAPCEPCENEVGSGTAQRLVQEVAAAHDGYRRLPGRPVHRREWRLTPEGFSVVDTIEGGYGVAVARFLLHPAIGIEGLEIGDPLELLEPLAPGDPREPFERHERHERHEQQHDPLEHHDPHEPHESLDPLPMPASGVLLLHGGQRVRWQVTGGRVRLVPAHWHPEFGLSVTSSCLEVEVEQHVCRLDLHWATSACPVAGGDSPNGSPDGDGVAPAPVQ